MFIAISGIIGAGKTTLSRTLAGKLGYKLLEEPVKTNPYLADYYQDKSRWSFEMQIFLLSKRYALHQKAIWLNIGGEGVVQDRSIYEDTCFAEVQYKHGHMDERTFKNYIDHFEIMKTSLMYPDLIVHLDVDVDTAISRISERARTAEKDAIPRDYMIDLDKAYQTYLDDLVSGNYTFVLKVPYNQYQTIEDIVDKISPYFEKRVSRFKKSPFKI